MDNEQNIIRRAVNGDREAFMKLYEAYFDTVFRFIHYKVGHRETAEDLAQDTFLKALASISNFRGDSKFQTWVMQIAKFTVMDYFRGKYQYQVVELEDYLASDRANLWEDDIDSAKEHKNCKNEALLAKLLALLPPNYQAILKKRFLEAMSLKECAESMNITVNNAKVLQYRAIEKLKKLL